MYILWYSRHVESKRKKKRKPQIKRWTMTNQKYKNPMTSVGLSWLSSETGFVIICDSIDMIWTWKLFGRQFDGFCFLLLILRVVSIAFYFKTKAKGERLKLNSFSSLLSRWSSLKPSNQKQILNRRNATKMPLNFFFILHHCCFSFSSILLSDYIFFYRKNSNCFFVGLLNWNWELWIAMLLVGS